MSIDSVERTVPLGFAEYGYTRSASVVRLDVNLHPESELRPCPNLVRPVFASSPIAIVFRFRVEPIRRAIKAIEGIVDRPAFPTFRYLP
jgi:hypothetical protein